MPSQEQQAAEALRDFDPCHPFREWIKEGADRIGEWAGCPMPLEGEHLVIHPSYPFAAVLNRKPDGSEESEYPKIRNEWFSSKLGTRVAICEVEPGQITLLVTGTSRAELELRTMGLYPVWGLEQESRALQLLAEQIRHAQIRSYLLTGRFMERSHKSGVFYMFRRLKPTVAMAPKGEGMKVLAALCMHPIGYYEGTFAGSMCPTDEVLAHLMLMRGDEPMFWRRANQHPAYYPEAGL